MIDEENTEVEQEINTDEQQQNVQEQEVDSVDWKAEALKNKAIAERLKKKLTTQPIINKVEHTDEIVETVKSLKMLEDKRQFGFEHGLSPQETDYAFKVSSGKPTKETIEDPFFKAGLDGLRAKQRLENNTPSSSSRSAIFQNKDFKEMSDDERRKAFEEASSKRKFNQ